MPESKTNRTPSWSELRANHRKKSTKCIKGNCTKGGKTKSCSHHPKTTRPTQSNARWANKTKWSFRFSKRPSTTRRPKTTSSRSKSPQLWPWRKSTPEKFSSRLRTKRPSVKDCKDWLMSISSASLSSNTKTIPTCSWLKKFSRRSLEKAHISGSRKECMKMIWVRLSSWRRIMPMCCLCPESMCRRFLSRLRSLLRKWLMRKLSKKRLRKFWEGSLTPGHTTHKTWGQPKSSLTTKIPLETSMYHLPQGFLYKKEVWLYWISDLMN